MPHLKTACINSQSQRHADIALLGAARQNQSMIGLRLEHLASLQTLRAVSTLQHLEYLFIRIPADTPTSLLVDTINSLHALRSLAIRQDNADVGGVNPLSTSDGYCTAIARPSQHPNLRWLSINANAATQCIIAAHLNPTSLQSLDLIVFSHKDAVYIAPIMAIYCLRNPGLFSLKVEVMSDVAALPEEVASLRDGPAFDARTFLDPFSTLTELRYLAIDGVPFFERDIVNLVLRAAHPLVQLTSLQLLPTPATSLDSDQLVPGDLMEILQAAKYCRALAFIETILDVDDIPSLGTQYDSDHQLEKLSVRTNGRPPKTIRDRLAVAKFLDAVFPYLKHVSSPIRDIEDGAESLIWGEVEEMVFSNQAIRADVWSKIGHIDNGKKAKKVRFCSP